MKLQEYSDFCRLAKDLHAMIMDYNYAKTRKALEPNWDGYTMPKGHDIIKDDTSLIDANLVTSRIRNTDLHRPVLDLDYGAKLIPCPKGNELQLKMFKPDWYGLGTKLRTTLLGCGLVSQIPEIKRNINGRITPIPENSILQQMPGAYAPDAILTLHTKHDLALTPSTTPGHHHLILDITLPWSKYSYLLYVLAGAGIIEHGFAKVSVRKGYSAVRPPWVKK